MAKSQAIEPAHGALQSYGRKPRLQLLEPPRWHAWRWRNEAARARRFIETFVRLPTGYGAGELVVLPSFERRILTALYKSLATFVSLPAGNGKTTFLAMIGLERIARGDQWAEVDVIATRKEQAREVLDEARHMVELSSEFLNGGDPLFSWHSEDGVLQYRPTGSIMAAHPARLRSVEGLNFNLAIIDEVGFAADDLVQSLIARVGKRPDARVLGMGTPGFDPNIMFELRATARDEALPGGVTYMEWSAPSDCATDDRRMWQHANPALGAGFLRRDAIEMQSQLLPERTFRVYHLGQWVETSGGWLPPGVWEACPHEPMPADKTEVVVAVEGTYRRTLAIVLATMGGSVHFVWAQSAARDEDVEKVLNQLAERFDVIEFTHPRRIRPGLFARLSQQGLPIQAWATSADNEAQSANEFYRAIVDARVAHDHNEMLSDHVAALRVRWAVDGSLRLARPDDGTNADAAMAARACWWRAYQLTETVISDAPRIY